MSERKMATIRRIDDINPIPGADAIEVATVGGWRVVVKKGEFQPGSVAVFLEIDSFVPTTLAPFLTKPGHEPKVYEGVQGERLRTVRLRKVLSQGLLLPISTVENLIYIDGTKFQVTEGADVSQFLGIVKYEAPIPAQLAGLVKGNFPSFVPKTDQPRIQNMARELDDLRQLTWECTEKMEGSSFTAYVNDDAFGVCSRNLELKRDDANSFWKIAIETDMENAIRSTGRNLAVQGELCGPGVQGNIYNLDKAKLFIYDIYDITAGAYLAPAERRQLVAQMNLTHVPVLDEMAKIGTMDEIIAMADGKSVVNPSQDREGLVFKSLDGQSSMKSISGRYLLGEK